MVGIVIADDEKIIRDGLLTIDWNSIGVEIKGVCGNGIEAFETLNSTGASILLTDIRMPGMNGIELIQKTKELLPKVKTILLTGYGEFEYARAAIAAGSVGYILKPTNPEEVLKAVEDAKKRIEKENTVEEVKAKLEKQVRENEVNLKEKFLSDVMSGKLISPTVIYDMSVEYNIKVSNYQVILVECERENLIDYGNEDKGDGDVIHQKYANFANSISKIVGDGNNCYAISMDYCTVCIIQNYNCEEFQKKSKEFCSDLSDKLKKMLCCEIYLGVSGFGSNLGELRALYNDAKYCLEIKDVLNIPIVFREDIVSNNGVEKILDYIYTNYMKDISLTSCSEYVHLNPIYITRLIRKQTGLTFLDILTKMRLTKAIEMLKHPEIKMNEVAAKVGINDSRYFSQVFKKHYGVTPTEYRSTLVKNDLVGE